MAVKLIVLFAMLFSVRSLTTVVAAPAEETDQDSYVVSGTLEELDVARESGKIKTDLGQTVAFTLTRPDLFKGLSIGKRITVRLNERGQVLKVMETAIPELPSIEK